MIRKRQDAVNHQTFITKEMIDESTLKAIAHKSDYYMELFEHQSKSRKQLLKALTDEHKNIFSVGYIRKYRLPAVATLQRAVKGLINEGIIEKAGNEYYFADPFFRMFVARY